MVKLVMKGLTAGGLKVLVDKYGGDSPMMTKMFKKMDLTPVFKNVKKVTAEELSKAIVDGTTQKGLGELLKMFGTAVTDNISALTD